MNEHAHEWILCVGNKMEEAWFRCGITDCEERLEVNEALSRLNEHPALKGAIAALVERAERVQEGEDWDLAEFILRYRVLLTAEEQEESEWVHPMTPGEVIESEERNEHQNNVRSESVGDDGQDAT